MGVKRTASLFHSFRSNAAKQVARFCCPLYDDTSWHVKQVYTRVL